MLKYYTILIPGKEFLKGKIMNMNDGSVGQPVKGNDYFVSIRNYGVLNADLTNTNCDGSNNIMQGNKK